MKIPLEWLEQYVKVNKKPEEVAESFTSLGLMLDKPISHYENGKYRTPVLDLEHRMDRADWLSITGCACDLAAFENTTFNFPEVDTAKPPIISEKNRVEIKVLCTDLVNRFNTRIFKNVKVKASPDWLKNRLEAYGIPSINNIVDVTNYVMVELGQTMHAQDIAKLEKPEIVIRRARKGEKLTTLLGETVTLDENCFVLTQNDLPTVLGGIVGGISTGIDETTTDIILDAGNYNQTNIRKTSRRLKILNESVLRNDKFLHPDLTEIALQRATKLILELAGGKCYKNIDWYPNKIPPKILRLRFSRILMISGIELPNDYIKKTLERLEYRVVSEDKYAFELEVPFFRTDVEVEDDIISDLLRIYNYTYIPLQQLSATPPTEITPKIYKFEDKIRDACVGLGLHEHITDPLVAADENIKEQVRLENSQSSLKNALRTDIYPGLKQVYNNYLKHQKESVGLFEIGKVYTRHNKTRGLEDFIETRVTQILFVDKSKTPDENSTAVRKILAGLLQELGTAIYSLSKNAAGVTEIFVGDATLGHIGWNRIVLFNEKLLPLSGETKRVIFDFQNLRTDDLSLMLAPTILLGVVQNEISKASADIKSIEVLPSRFDDKTKNLKNVLFRINHFSNNFAEIRKTILKILEEKFNAVAK